jgi:hypothetical protein
MSQPIFTIDARGNIMLELIQGYFDLDQTRMWREINASFSALLEILKRKHIEYQSLKNGLVPRPDRNEAALVFDRTLIKSGSYGFEVFNRILPVLDRDVTLSVLCGDLIGGREMQDRLYEAFSEEVVLTRSCNWEQSNQFFIVYINNLSNEMLVRLRGALNEYPGYVGWVNCYAPSFLKTYFSFTLSNCFLKAKKLIIQGHEDDRPNTEDVNTIGFAFEEYGYTCKSLQSMYNDLFLHYKIETAVYRGFESDTHFSLNAISKAVVPLDHCEVQVQEEKLLKYLRQQKEGSMKRAGLLALGTGELQTKIRERLARNYIFNMAYDEEHATMKFNTVLNFQPKATGKLVKVTATLEYKPSQKLLRLITMF